MSDIIWQLEPDWSDGVTENLAWLTSVHISPTGAEQREAWRISPRRTFEFSVLAAGVERQRWENLLYLNGSTVWQMPVWPDAWILPVAVPAGATQVFVPTAGRDFSAGGQALLRYDDRYELITLSTVINNRITLVSPTVQRWPAGSWLWPTRSAVLTDPPAITRITDDLLSAQVRLRINEHNAFPDTTMLEMYRGFPVLQPASDRSSDLTAEYQRMQQLLDNNVGIPRVTDTASRPFGMQSHSWVQVGRDEQRQLRQLFYYLRGRQRSLWVASQATDLHPLSVAGIQLDIVAYDFGDPQPGRRDLQITLRNGQRLYRRVNSASKVSASIERLELDTPLAITATDIADISLMQLCRLNSDTVSWQHLTDADGLAQIGVTFRGVRDELE